MNYIKNSKKLKKIIAISSFIVYVLLFQFLNKFFSGQIAILGIIPVIIFGILYGLWGGLIAGATCFPATVFLYCFSGEETFLTVFGNFYNSFGRVLGQFGLIAIGGIVGYMHDLSQKSKRTLNDLQMAETALKKAKDTLDEQVKERTTKLINVNEELEQQIKVRKNAEAEQSKFSQAVEQAQDLIKILKQDGTIEYINPATEKITGYTAEEIVGQNPFRSQKSDDDNLYYNLLDKIKKGGIWSGRQTNIKKDGNTIELESVISPIHDKAGNLINFLAISRDVTREVMLEEQRNRAAEELKEAKKEAEKANHAKSSFLANMSHEIRTPMNGVIGFTELLLDTGLNAEQEDYAQTIRRSGESLLSLIDDILDYTKIEAGKIDFEEIDFDLEMLVYDVCEIIQPRTDKGVEILCRIGDNLPAKVMGDPHRIKQVLVNLMGNAAKFTHAGEIELSVDVEEERDGRFMIHARTRDTGIGIPADRVEAIFELFQQADGSTTREYGGTGLGLSISRQIAQSMGGNTWAESEGGKGSTFHFTALLKQSKKMASKRLTPVSLPGKKALIADDNSSNLEILTHLLKSAGMHVTGFSNGEKALHAIQGSFSANAPFDVCIFDIKMPGLNGFQLANKIRSLHGDSMPLLAFSASIKGDALKCREAGFNGFLPKPISRIKLFTMIEHLLGGSTDKVKSDKTKLLTQYSMREDAKHSISILLAEDNPLNQKLAVKLLTKAGYSVDIANNGREVVEKIAAEPEKHDIILMDIQMPELNGLDATRAIRNAERGMRNNSKSDAKLFRNPKSAFHIPIIAMTANAMKGDREKCLEAGMNDYISKPIKREIVFDVLRKWVIENVS